MNSSIDAIDPDGDKLDFSYEWRVDGRPAGDDRPDFRVSKVRKGARIELSVVARDGKLASSPVSASATVGNQPPIIVGAVFEPEGPISVASDVGVRPQATDPDGDTLDFETTWRVNGRIVAENEPVLSRTKFRRGDKVSFSIVATDGNAKSTVFSSPSVKVGNAPPKIESYPKGFGADGALNYQVKASDADGDKNLRYKLVKSPKGMSIDNFEGLVTWLPSMDQAGKHPVEIEVDDRRGGTWRQSFDLEVAFGAPPASGQ